MYVCTCIIPSSCSIRVSCAENGEQEHNPRAKTKRVRTTFTEEQLQVLQANFNLDSNPDGQDLERIAQITGLSKRVTQVWFQNSRARQKKYFNNQSKNGHSHGHVHANGQHMNNNNLIGAGSNGSGGGAGSNGPNANGMGGNSNNNNPVVGSSNKPGTPLGGELCSGVRVANKFQMACSLSWSNLAFLRWEKNGIF